ncbi:uncharacterized protein [Nicotiana tomentosiformis]|uniref:uncharacterized protein n=1 Tax=Nicotiana tomentosiformis TaxID=4098 RepID=UPI00388CA56A
MANNELGNIAFGDVDIEDDQMDEGALPSDTVVNPKGGNNTGHAMAITKKSGRGRNTPTSSQRQLVDDEQVVDEEEIPNNVVQANYEVHIDVDDNVGETQEEVNPFRDHVIDIPEPVMQKAKAPVPKPPPLYLQRLANQNGENQFKTFIDMMNSISIYVPLFEALEQMPSYAKFMKETKKQSMNLETIKVMHQFILPADFVILDCEVDYEVPIILERHFLATGKALVDMEARKLTYREGDKKVVFHVCKSMRQPNSNEVCSFVDLVTDVIIDDTSATINVGDMLEAPSIEEPPTLELKPLPPHLRYEVLGPISYLSVIIYSCLTNVQVDSTLAILHKRKKAIGWTLADIRGINPTFCMHKINLEEDSKSSIEHQRKLNELFKT